MVGLIHGDYHFDYAFSARGGECHHGNDNRWGRLLLLYACIGDDSPGRYCAVDVELERSQQHLRYSGSPQRALGLYGSEHGRYV